MRKEMEAEVLFRGRPMSTPTRRSIEYCAGTPTITVKRMKPLSKNRLCKENSASLGNSSPKKRKGPKGGSPSEELFPCTRQTLINTRKNAQYKHIDISIEVVYRNQKRPPSPSSKFAVSTTTMRRRAGQRSQKLLLEEEEKLGSGVVKQTKIKWNPVLEYIQDAVSTTTQSSDNSAGGVPQPCLRPPAQPVDSPVVNFKHPITVKKIIYKDDVLFYKHNSNNYNNNKSFLK